MGCELLKSAAKIEFMHVPYKGANPAINDVVGGQMHFGFNSIPAVLPLVKAGKLRGLGVGGPKRSPAAPDIPAIAETLPGFECINWYAMLAPAGTPPAIVMKLNAEMVKMIADPPFAQRLLDLGSEPQSSTPAGLAAYMKQESERWAKVIKAAGIKVER
jgi:tripartite-type tricarboxylate transporter receptor subunit TctC